MHRNVLRAVLAVSVTTLVAPNVFAEESYGDCGGGDSGVLDEVRMKLDEGKVREARDELISLLRQGQVERWEQGDALALLAETQLRFGQNALAALNYRNAIAAYGSLGDDERAETLRSSRAVALYRAGRSAAALREARAFLAASCRESNDSDAVACYGAHLVAGFASRTAAARRDALNAAAALRSDVPDLESSFASVRALFGSTRRTLVASAR